MDDRTYSVIELAGGLSELFATAFPDEIWVRGEIRNLKRSKPGHVYFDLVDETGLGAGTQAILSVVLFDSTRTVVNNVLKRAGGGIRMDDGIEIRIRGVIDYYAAQSRVQLRMSMIDPAHTLGRLEADKRALLAALDAEDLLERNARTSLAPMPLRVALVTSHGSAACDDFLDELANSGFAWRVSCFDTLVQGERAPASLAAALRTAAARDDIDVIALVRGGGARTDLAAFDHERVARAVATMPVPVFTGIGHEIDESVADRVAHTRYKTPTACAVGLLDRARSFVERLDAIGGSIAVETTRSITRHRRRLSTNATAVTHRSEAALRLAGGRLEGQRQRTAIHAEHRLATASERLDGSVERLTVNARRAVHEAGRRNEAADRTVSIVDPARALARGWSITRDEQGRVVTDPAALAIGARLMTTVAGGTIRSRTEALDTDDAAKTDPDTSARSTAT